MPELLALSAVYEKLRKAIAECGGQSAFAAKAGVSPSYVSDVLNARCAPSGAILRSIGLRKVVLYAPAEAAGAIQ